MIILNEINAKITNIKKNFKKNDSDCIFLSTSNENHLIYDYDSFHSGVLKIIYWPHDDYIGIEFYDNHNDSVTGNLQNILIFLRKLNEFLLRKNQNIAYEIFDDILRELNDLININQ